MQTMITPRWPPRPCPRERCGRCQYRSIRRPASFASLLLLTYGLAIGFVEESLFRGIGVTAFRTNGYLRGAGRAADARRVRAGHQEGGPIQVFSTLATGYSVDLVRLVSGGLLLGAVLHGLWDFGILSAGVVGDAYRWVPIFTLVGAGLVLALLLGRRRIEPREAVAATPTGATGECIQRSACTGRGGLAGDAPGPGAHLLPASRASRSRRVHGRT